MIICIFTSKTCVKVTESEVHGWLGYAGWDNNFKDYVEVDFKEIIIHPQYKCDPGTKEIPHGIQIM